jgi:hypothetical protein
MSHQQPPTNKFQKNTSFTFHLIHERSEYHCDAKLSAWAYLLLLHTTMWPFLLVSLLPVLEITQTEAKLQAERLLHPM